MLLSLFVLLCPMSTAIQESLEREITLDDDPEIVDCMMRYFYELDYDDGFTLTWDDDVDPPLSTPLLRNAQVWSAAEFYGVSGLKTLAVSRTINLFHINQYWWKDFASAVQFVENSTTGTGSDLRKAYLAEFLRVRQDLFKSGDETTSVLRASGDFLFDALRLDCERQKKVVRLKVNFG